MKRGLARGADGRVRCWWPKDDPLYLRYHDEEWGVPVADDVRLFEKLCLEGFQAGLSWLTILRKRDAFRRAFDGFDFHRVTRFGPADVKRLLGDPGIVRHRGKIESTLHNAGRAVELSRLTGSLAAYFWQWEPPPASRPKRITYEALVGKPVPPQAVQLSKALRSMEWRFVGPTTIYAFMQAMGLVNDHLEGCFRRAEIEALRSGFLRPSRTVTTNASPETRRTGRPAPRGAARSSGQRTAGRRATGSSGRRSRR